MVILNYKDNIEHDIRMGNNMSEELNEDIIISYEELARIVHLYLNPWCNISLPYPNMCADSVRKIRLEFDKLKSKSEIIEKEYSIEKQKIQYLCNYLRECVNSSEPMTSLVKDNIRKMLIQLE